MKNRIKSLLAILSCLAFLFAFTACEDQGPAEEAGEQIDEAAETTTEKVEEAGEEVQEAVEEGGEKLEEAGEEMQN